MTNIVENMDMVRKVAWNFARRNRVWEFEDLFSEACVAYLEGELAYNRNATEETNKTTYLWNCMNTHLLNLVFTNESKYLKREVDLDMDMVPGSGLEDPAEAIVAAERWNDFEEHLDPVCKDICDIVVHSKNAYLPIETPKLCRGVIRDELRARGWSWSAIWAGYRELRQALLQA